MQIQSNTIQKLKTFEYILQNGYQSIFIDNVLSKLVSIEKGKSIKELKKVVLRGFVGKTAYRFFFWLIADLRGKHDELQEYRGGKVLQQVGFQMIYNTFLL